MKRLISTLAFLAVLSVTALPVAAQTRDRCTNRRTAQSTRYSPRYDNRNYEVYRDGRNDDYRYEEDRSIWDRSRDKITTAGGAVGGAVLGGLIGGKKGAIIGAITGGAGAAIYTYKIRKNDRRF